MSDSQFWIGNYDFINLSRPPSRVKGKLAREVRPGEDGVTFFRTGKKTEPFQLLSVRDCQDIEDVEQTLARYESLAGEEPVELWWGDIEWGDVIVHDVETIDGGTYATLLGIGGILGNSNAILRCVWTLEYVPLTENQEEQQE